MKIVAIALAALLVDAGPGSAAPRPRPAPGSAPSTAPIRPASARAASLLPHRLLYVIPADTQHTLSAETPELRALQDTLAALFVASMRGEVLSRFADYTVVRSTAAQDSLLATALADRSLFNRYDELVVARVTLWATDADRQGGQVRARVSVAFRPWDPADALTLTGEGFAGSADAPLLQTAVSALEQATRRAARALEQERAQLVR